MRHLLVFRNNFALDARFTLDVPGNSDGINPDKEEVNLRIGSGDGAFSTTIPVGKFKRLLQGRLFTFIGRVDGLDIAATFTRGSSLAGPWTFAAAVHGVNLTGVLPQAQGRYPLNSPWDPIPAVTWLRRRSFTSRLLKKVVHASTGSA